MQDSDKDQLAIIENDPSARVLINAGPGTGKTETACRRISWLINDANLTPSQILVLSFTRTAVAEMKARVKNQLTLIEEGDEVNVRTMDSFAWQNNLGFSSGSGSPQSFKSAIELATKEVQGNPDIRELLSNLQHLVIDEAQDIVGDRAGYLASIIESLAPECGISVFSDDAQAIYGFADEDFKSTGESYTLPELIRDYFSQEFVELELTRIYRTGDKNLIELFTDGRKLANSNKSGAEKFASMKTLISRIAHESSTRIPIGREGDLDGNPNSFVLFRRRGEALLGSQNMGAKAHRTRLRGQSQPIAAWIAKCFWDFKLPIVSESEFTQLYESRISNPTTPANQAWRLLLKFAGNKNHAVSLSNLIEVLSLANPPSELAASEIGLDGPIFATIHSAKGRETDEVFLCLYLPENDDDSTTTEEEARVLFVGATRAKSNLRIAMVDQIYAGTLPSGRAYRRSYSQRFKTHFVNIEIGQKNDLDAIGLVGKSSHPTQDEALGAQKWLALQPNSVQEVSMQKININNSWPYVLLNTPDANDNSMKLGLFAEPVQQDIFDACGKNATPRNIKFVQFFGAQTLVVPSESSERDTLHEPWASSGFLLAPVISSFPQAFYRKRK